MNNNEQVKHALKILYNLDFNLIYSLITIIKSNKSDKLITLFFLVKRSLLRCFLVLFLCYNIYVRKNKSQLQIYTTLPILGGKISIYKLDLMYTLFFIFGSCYISRFIFCIEKQIFMTGQASITYIFILNHISHMRLRFFSISHQVEKVALFFYIIIIAAIKGSAFFSNHTNCKKQCFFSYYSNYERQRSFLKLDLS